jgi:hypothetical protein
MALITAARMQAASGKACISARGFTLSCNDSMALGWDGSPGSQVPPGEVTAALR